MNASALRARASRQRRGRHAVAAVLPVIGLLFAGCATQLGPRTVVPAHYAYNQAMVRAWDEQLLLNLVRLRYRDNPQFLQVGNVVAKYEIGIGWGVSGSFDFDGDASAGTSGSVGYSESPTITYRPVQGEEFVESLLTPLRPETLVLLSQSGWSIERLMRCCVQRLNDFGNAVAAAGPTPDYVPDFEEFLDLARSFRDLQKRGQVRVVPASDHRLEVWIEGDDPAARGLRDRLGLGSEVGQILSPGQSPDAGTAGIVVSGRSLLAVMFFLSQAVEPPAEHVEQGLVTVTRHDDGTVFDWSRVTDGLLRVRSTPSRPGHAAVAVPYRGHWFYIDDADLTSKTTFSLLSYLFILKSGGQDGTEPLLTLGVG